MNDTNASTGAPPLRQTVAAKLEYQSGFGNEFATEAVSGALPLGQNAPQYVPFGLYAEQLSGSAFTAPRGTNRRSWLYRIRPTAVHPPFVRIDASHLRHDYVNPASPNQMRWDPASLPDVPTDFVTGLMTFAGNGSPLEHSGCAIHLYAANTAMVDRYFFNADGEMLVIPQHGGLRLLTELGIVEVRPGEVAVIPRGLRLRVELLDDVARGYVCENHGAPFRLPDLGPIGANGLANPRDFLTPVAWFEQREGAAELLQKYGGNLWRTLIEHSPLDVVAWHGNYAPYKYNLLAFNAVGSVTYDHPDPSVFLTLQSRTETPGVDAIDFLVVPPRWLAMEHSFRPPYFHRNIASEFMGLIHGVHDAKSEGFAPGGASLHNCMAGHGPDAASYRAALAADTRTPRKMTDTLSFMIETRLPLLPTRFALQSPLLQGNYHEHWLALANHFDPLAGLSTT